MATDSLSPTRPQIKTGVYTTRQDDWSGIEVINAEGLTVATITACTPEFLEQSLAAPEMLDALCLAQRKLREHYTERDSEELRTVETAIAKAKQSTVQTHGD